MLFLFLPFLFVSFFFFAAFLDYKNSGYVPRSIKIYGVMSFIWLLASLFSLGEARERNVRYQDESLVLFSNYYFQAMTTNKLVNQAEYTVLISEAQKHNVRHAERLKKQYNLWDGYQYRIGYSDERINRFFHPFSSMTFTEDLLDVSLDIIEEETYSFYEKKANIVKTDDSNTN